MKSYNTLALTVFDNNLTTITKNLKKSYNTLDLTVFDNNLTKHIVKSPALTNKFIFLTQVDKMPYPGNSPGTRPSSAGVGAGEGGFSSAVGL